MWLLDQLAEQHIKAAQDKGELSHLPGRVNLSSSMMIVTYLQNSERAIGCLKIQAFYRQSLKYAVRL